MAPDAAPVAGAIGGRAYALQRAMPVVGVAGLVAWLAFTPFAADVPTLPLDRAQAEAIAVAALAERGVRLAPPWQTMSIRASCHQRAEPARVARVRVARRRA